MKSKNTFLRSLVLAALAGLPALGGFAATNVVTIGNYWFSPTNITIKPGDTIVWSNIVMTPHDSTSSSGLWNSPQLAQNKTFSYTFTNAGNYPYICALHIVGHPEQTGTVSVAISPNLPPTVLITNPPSGTVFTAPANVTIQASAADSDGSVTNVQFLVGATVLANDNSAPYAATTNGLPAGNYTFSAIASDNNGAKATNSTSITVNNPPTLAITNPPSGTILTAPANVTIQASAADSDGSVTNVQFLVGATVLANDNSAPYAATTNGLPAGSYTLSAIASDNHGAKATNSISITVNNPPPSSVTILNPSFNGTSFSFSFATQVGYTYTAQFTPSLNPTNWLTFTNLNGSGSTVQVTDLTPTNSQRLYRVGAQ